MGMDLILGLQWGDEGKGKIVDVVTQKYDIVARFQGGPNAGHTLNFDGIQHILHTIPSGIFHDHVINIVGNGVVIDPVSFVKELKLLEDRNIDYKNKLLISKKAHLILPTHRLIDAASEASKGKEKIGSTLRGIGPAYMDKTGRNGLRVGDIVLDNWKEKYKTLAKKHLELLKFYDSKIDFNLKELEQAFYDAIEVMKQLVLTDSENYLHQALREGKKILGEGAQGTLLDVDFGSYPFVTSSTTSAAGACTGLGVSPNKIETIKGIFKAYCTRVGSGPFPTELFGEAEEYIRHVGKEFGATTKRPRRCGWLDLVALKYAIQINGVNELIMMKADVLSNLPEIKACIAYKKNGEEMDTVPYDIESVEPIYKTFKGWNKDLTDVEKKEDLPKELMDYISFIESSLAVPIKIVSVGPDRKQTILI